MVWRLATGCWAVVPQLAIGCTVVLDITICVRAMGLKLIISVKTVGCAVTLDALEPRILRIFHCNVKAAKSSAVTSAREAQKN